MLIPLKTLLDKFRWANLNAIGFVMSVTEILPNACRGFGKLTFNSDVWFENINI